jgi:hypothetical protein
MARNGQLYQVDGNGKDAGWSATLPAGTYKAVQRVGCPGETGPTFVVRSEQTLLGIVVQVGCDYH